MSTPRRPAPRSRRRTQEPEFGDWRVQVDKPHETEHLKARRMSVVRRLQARVDFWQAQQPTYYTDFQEDDQQTSKRKATLRLMVAVLLLLPLSVVMVYALMVQLYHAAPVVSNFDFWQSVPVWYTVLGALVFISVKYFRLVDAVLMYAYVLGHELTHAIAALICFGKVQAICVDLDGGYVDTDKDNLFVSLSPYFVPLWMLVWLGVLFVANLVYPFETYLPWFYAGFGFWWCFHVYWTLWIIPREQPDLLENGVALSFLIIMLTNILALLLVLRCFGVITFGGYWQDFKACAVEIYTTYAELAAWIYHQF